MRSTPYMQYTCKTKSIRWEVLEDFYLANTWSDNTVHEFIANITVVAFKVLPLGSYALMPAPSPPFKTILELALWNGFRSCHRITPDSSKCLPFNISFIFRNRKWSLGARFSEQGESYSTVISLLATSYLTDTVLR
jgi:hypothetical protein